METIQEIFTQSSNKHPLALQKGDLVDIIAPSSKCHSSVLPKLKNVLESWGLGCHIPEDIFGDNLLYANSDEKRFAHLQHALLNKESKLIWCLLGGFGATKLIPLLSTLKKPAKSKLFVGFSDATALHIFLQGQWGWPTIHGPSGYQVCLDRISKDSVTRLKNMLFGLGEAEAYTQLAPMNAAASIDATITAPIIGGNLHMIQASLGTPWQMKTQGKIILIEEVNERAYRIDRILTQLQQAGLFEGVKAILFGDLIDKGEPNGQFLVMKTVEEFAAQCALPVLKINDVGHGLVNNPILLGSNARLGLGARCFLDFSSNRPTA